MDISHDMSHDVGGAAALVTGGGSGIGRAVAEQLARAGARVLVADVRGEAAEEVAATLQAQGAEAVACPVDVTEPAQVSAMVGTAVARFGGLQIAVNNAGTTGAFAFTGDADLDDWRRTVDLNLTGTFLCLRAELAHMAGNGGGAVVNMSSGAGVKGFPGLPAYVASKHAVIGLTRAAALEYARKGIRVNAVCPGSTRTPMLEGFTGGNEEALAGMGRMTPMGRLGRPEEIAAAVVWLCSPAASYVTGHALAADGGVIAT